MPVAGFRPGDRVTVPSGRAALVLGVKRVQGRERVTVAYEQPGGGYSQRRAFDAAALRLRQRA